MVSVLIWEAAGGGLFGTSPIAGVSPGSRNVTIPDQLIGADGGVSVPFAGRVRVVSRPSTCKRSSSVWQQRQSSRVIVTITKKRNLCCDSLR